MPLLHVEPLPPRTTPDDLLDLLAGPGGLDRRRVGRIELRGRTATVEVPEGWTARLVRDLDGIELKDRRLRVWAEAEPPAPGTEDGHFQRLARLLELESQAEARQAQEQVQRLSAAEAEKTGLCLADLVITEEYPGLGGRRIVTLARRNRDLALPWTRLQAGSPVLLSAQGGGTGRRGVVYERQERWLRVALAETPDEDESGPYRVDLAGDETATRRQQAALERARTATGDRLAELRRVLLGEAEPAFGPEEEISPLDPSLNPSQTAAVRFALSARDLAILHGPPGTGKTTTVVELIRQAVRRGEKVLACAPSNLAVDNLLERLVAADVKAVRLGHPARVLPALREHTLDLMVEEHEDTRLARKFAKEAYALFRKASRFTRAKPEPGARRDARQEARALLADARRLEDQAAERILETASVLCATLTGLDAEVLGRRTFDLAVIDEAAQATEPACWVPLPRCRRLVLAGDHCQLPPTILSAEAAAQGFGVSLMERLAWRYGQAVTRRVTVQYRMNEAIMAFPSREFYDAELSADPSVAGHLLRHLPGVKDTPLTGAPVYFIDTAGAGFEEESEPDGDSRFNPEEAALVCRQVRALLDAAVPSEDIAVITPYSAQVRLLRDRLRVPGLEVDSVDGFQGREKEAVVISLVRSNPAGEIGFLADVRRTNVALTRARRLLLVVGDSATLAGHPFYHRLLTYFEEAGAYHTVWEENVG